MIAQFHTTTALLWRHRRSPTSCPAAGMPKGCAPREPHKPKRTVMTFPGTPDHESHDRFPLPQPLPRAGEGRFVSRIRDFHIKASLRAQDGLGFTSGMASTPAWPSVPCPSSAISTPGPWRPPRPGGKPAACALPAVSRTARAAGQRVRDPRSPWHR